MKEIITIGNSPFTTKKPIKSKHIWNVDPPADPSSPTQMEIDYKNYYNNYNTTFYANLENGIVLNTHGNIPHCKSKVGKW